MLRCLLKNARMLDSSGQGINVNIVTENKIITEVTQQEINIPAVEYDLTGYTIMPGFINTHVHIFDSYDGFNKEKLNKWAESGITYLRDEGILSRHTTSEAVAWRDLISKDCIYPGLSVCGRFISSVNGYGGLEPLEVSTISEARDAVKKQVSEGVDHIKIALDTGYDTFTRCLSKLPLDILEAICDEAHKLNKPVSAHVTASDQLEILLKAGIDEAAHTCYDPISDETLEYMVKNHIFMTPTLSIYGEIMVEQNAPVLQAAMSNTKRFVDLGGIIGLGNDYIEEKPIWSTVGMPIMEIELLRTAGLTMRQIIEAATLGGARILRKEEYGKIQKSCAADLIAVKGDPYELPYLLSNIQFVMKDGVVIRV